jgi:glycosyltransferase involved in cell wall biosynthesis
MTTPTPTAIQPVVIEPCLLIPPRPPRPDGRPVRVVELLATGTTGGAQQQVHSLVSRLDPARYETTVISLSDGRAVRRMQAAGIDVRLIDEPDDRLAARRVTELLKTLRPDVLHLHMYRAEVVGTRAALALAEAGLPRPYVISTVHSSRRRSEEDQELLRGLTPSMDRLIAVSGAIVRKMGAEGRVGPPVELIHNGVDLTRYAQTEACCTLPQEYGFPEGTPVVGVVARLEPEKGHPTLLEAWAQVVERVPEARLLVVGEGSRRSALEAQGRELGLLGEECDGDSCVGTRQARPGAKVIFTGLRDDIPAVTAALDVAVLPSYREAQGLALLEAMALRRPVVASNVGGIPEAVEDGRTGLLVPPHDAPALADAIVRLLTDHPLADSLARAGYDLVHERFCIERMVDSISRLYDEGADLMAARLKQRGAA